MGVEGSVTAFVAVGCDRRIGYVLSCDSNYILGLGTARRC